MVGQSILHYSITEKLGEGGMGVVYKATDSKLNRTVALKFLPEHLEGGQQDLDRFLQEARSAATLNHPNICTIYGIEESDGKHFIVMEYIEGMTLLEKKSSLSLKQAIDFGVQIADGLAAAHEKGIVHRDIKPENIMVRKDGRIQIMDFGLAKLRSASRLTKEGATVGTIGYMSPEQIQGQDVDHRSDIFSFGVLLYEMIAGESPFKGVHETAIIYEIVNVDPLPIGSTKPEVDSELDAIVLECLAKDPVDRYQSAAEVARNLRRVKRESSRSRVSRITGVRPVPAQPSAEMAAQTVSVRSTSVLPWIIVGLLCVLSAALAWFAFFTGSETVAEDRLTILRPKGTTVPMELGGHTAISPDGRMVAMVASDSTGIWNLYVRRLDDMKPHVLPGTAGARWPFWSPDNKWIAYILQDKIMKINVEGGAPQTVVGFEDARGGAWGQHGTILLGSRSGGLYKVSVNGGNTSAVTKIDSIAGDRSHRWPSFLPDGMHFLFLSSRSNRETDKIGVGSIDSGVISYPVEVSSNVHYAAGYIFYVRDGWVTAQPFDEKSLQNTGEPFTIIESVASHSGMQRSDFSVSSNGDIFCNLGFLTDVTRKITYIGKDGNEIPGMEINGGIIQLRISHDGSRIATSERDGGESDIWIYDLARNLRSRLTFEKGFDAFPLWSLDGNEIYYAAGDSGKFRLVSRNVRGTGQRTVIFESQSWVRPFSIARKEPLIAFSQRKKGGLDDIYVLRVGSSEPPMRVTNGEFDYDRPAISPDGRWVAYESNETGTSQIYITTYPSSGARWQATSFEGGSFFPFWHPQGKQLFYVDRNNDFYSVSIEVEKDAVVIGVPQKMFTRPYLGLGGMPFDIFPDGDRFAVVTRASGFDAVSEQEETMMLVRNWERPKQ